MRQILDTTSNTVLMIVCNKHIDGVLNQLDRYFIDGGDVERSESCEVCQKED